MHFVIEMKNERIHELDKRLILMETVVRGWETLGGCSLRPLLPERFLSGTCRG